jgi:hypothetical protein
MAPLACLVLDVVGHSYIWRTGQATTMAENEAALTPYGVVRHMIVEDGRDPRRGGEKWEPFFYDVRKKLHPKADEKELKKLTEPSDRHIKRLVAQVREEISRPPDAAPKKTKQQMTIESAVKQALENATIDGGTY